MKKKRTTRKVAVKPQPNYVTAEQVREMMEDHVDDIGPRQTLVWCIALLCASALLITSIVMYG